MSRRVIKLAVGFLAVAGAAAFLGWQYLGYLDAVDGPEVTPFTPRPPVEIAEVVPAEGAVTLRNVSYAAAAGDIPGWRVRAGDSAATVAADADGSAAVVPWRGSDRPAWRQPLGGQGNSSPIIVGERIFFTIADGGPTLWLVCFNLENGFGVWRQPVSREPFPPGMKRRATPLPRPALTARGCSWPMPPPTRCT